MRADDPCAITYSPRPSGPPEEPCCFFHVSCHVWLLYKTTLSRQTSDCCTPSWLPRIHLSASDQPTTACSWSSLSFSCYVPPLHVQSEPSEKAQRGVPVVCNLPFARVKGDPSGPSKLYAPVGLGHHDQFNTGMVNQSNSSMPFVFMTTQTPSSSQCPHAGVESISMIFSYQYSQLTQNHPMNFPRLFALMFMRWILQTPTELSIAHSGGGMTQLVLGSVEEFDREPAVGIILIIVWHPPSFS